MKTKFFKNLTFATKLFSSAAAVSLALSAYVAPAQAAAAPVKEWSFLVFLNGNNSLDSFGADDINEMEQVGSTANINVVVQWASYARKDVYRMLVEKDNKPSQVTSKVVQNMGAVDMGNSDNLVAFVAWAHENYPAKHYFIDVWNHGNGWHKNSSRLLNFELKPTDISFDDKTGNAITTEQLGTALEASANIIGHKVDLYGSDACLMAMVEVATQMKNSVEYSVGSEETEPGEGWPYGDFLTAWTALGNQATAPQVAVALGKAYKASYQHGSQGTQEITLSAFDLSKVDTFNDSLKKFSSTLNGLARSNRAAINSAAQASLSFALPDYVDLKDFLAQLESHHAGVDSALISEVRTSLSQFVFANETTTSFSRAGGVSFWLPTSSYDYNEYKDRYAGLEFTKYTGWDLVLDTLFK